MKNKKLLSLLLTAAITTATIIPASAYALVNGDINGDGALTSADLELLQGFVLGKNTFTDAEFTAADVNGDQAVDVYDVTHLRKLILSTDRDISFTAVTDRLNNGITDALKKLDLQEGGAVVRSAEELEAALSEYFSQSVVDTYSEKYNDEFFEESVLFIKPAYFDPAKYRNATSVTSLSCGCNTSYAGVYTTGPTVDIGLNIRKAHDYNSASLGTIPPGTVFTVTHANGKDNGCFGHVTYNGITGYVNMGFVTKVSDPAPVYSAIPDIKVDEIKYSQGTVTVTASEYDAGEKLGFAAAVLAQAVIPQKDYYASEAQWTVTTTSSTTTTTTTTTYSYPLAQARMKDKNITNIKQAFDDCSLLANITYETYATTGTLQSFADYGFKNRKGNCYVMAAMFCEMARLLGYDAKLVSGTVGLANGGRGPHSWVEIIVDGTLYICDPDCAWECYYHNQPNRYAYYMTRYGAGNTWDYAKNGYVD